MENDHQCRRRQQQNTVKLVSEHFIKPKYEIDASKQPYHLGPIDIVMLSIDPIQKGLLYTFRNLNTSSSSTPNVIVSHLLDTLKESLSIALVHFYPLAGRFTIQKHPEENTSSIFIDCNKGPGARLIHATALELTVSDVGSPVDVTIAHPFFDLGERYLNFDCHTKALLSIQVTQLLDGVFIGFSISHSVVDGTSFIHFINMLSEIFTTLSNDCTNSDDTNKIAHISRVPILNYRPWFSNEDVPIIKFPFMEIDKSICHGYNPGLLRERIFHFSSTSMAKLKAKANQECGSNNNNNNNNNNNDDVVVSSFQALTALVWRSITRVRCLPLDELTACSLAIGARPRLDPPLTNDYFGNFIRKAQWACKVEELLGNGLGWAAMNLQKLIERTDGKAILKFYKKFAKSPFLIPRAINPDSHGSNNVIMGGSGRFDMYGPDFGLGQAVAARMGSGNKDDGKVTANPGCEGGGSVDLEICLRPHIMEALEADQDFMSFVSSS